MFVFTETEDPKTYYKTIRCHIPGLQCYTERSIAMEVLYYDNDADGIREYVQRQLAVELTHLILDKQFEKEKAEQKFKSNATGKYQYLGTKYEEEWITFSNDLVSNEALNYLDYKVKPWAIENADDSVLGSYYHNGGKVSVDFNAVDQQNEVVEELTKYFGDCLSKQVKCPCGIDDQPDALSTLKSVIIHLNDHRHWTREEIADWLETLDIDITLKEE